MALDWMFQTSVFLLPFLFLGRYQLGVGGEAIFPYLFSLLCSPLSTPSLDFTSHQSDVLLPYFLHSESITYNSPDPCSSFFMLQLFSAPIISFFVHTCLHITVARTYEQSYKQMGTFFIHTWIIFLSSTQLPSQSPMQPLHILLMSYEIKRGTKLDWPLSNLHCSS